MPGDYSRFTDRPRKRFAAVLLQQGRVQLDADWNEAQALRVRHDRTQAVDTFGPCAVPRATTPDGFRVALAAGSPLDLTLGAGRAYVEGRQVEIFPHEGCTYLSQPFLPDPPPLAGIPGPTALVYLDVWDREVTALEDPDLLDPALGGVDTATRIQTVWQVRVLSGAGRRVPLDCGADLDALLPPSAGRLSTRAVQPPASSDPCVLPESGGYRGVENRLYRVEVHDGGGGGSARIKWSRDNASIVSRVEAIATAAQSTLTVARIGRDAVLRFRVDDWVEVLDDHRDLRGEPGVMARVTAVDEAERTLRLDRALPAGVFDHTDPARHTRVRRWDQSAAVDGDGLLAVTGAWTALEDGVEVRLVVDPAAPGGAVRPGDHWVFAARAADASVEALADAPPRGIVHRYCALATLAGLGGAAAPTVTDCRRLWPAETGGGGCDCSVCVTPESHASGALTIQYALDQVRESGGTVCLGAGVYPLRESPLRITGGRSVTLRGHGQRTMVVWPGDGPALLIEASTEVVVQDLAILAAGGGSAVSARNCAGLTIERCELMHTGGQRTTPVIALSGTLLLAAIRDNLIAGSVGLAGGGERDQAYFLAGRLLVTDNYFAVERAGIALGRTSLMLLETRLAGNFVLGGAQGGIGVLGAVAPGHTLNVHGNDVFVRADAIVVGTDGARITDNDIGPGGGTASGAAAGSGAGIVLARGLDSTGIDRCQVLGNRVLGVGGAGIAVRAHLRSAMIKQNVIESAGGGGIVFEEQGSADALVIENNQLLDIAPRANTAGAAVLGIAVLHAGQVAIVGNTVRGVGATAVQSAQRAAIAVAACATVRIAGNDLADVGPADFVNESAGIEVLGPFERLAVTDNVVRRTAGPAAGTAWGLRVRRAAATPGAAAGLLVLDAGARVVAVGARDLRALAPGEQSTTIRGNLFEAYGGAPAIEVLAAGSTVLGDNRCIASGAPRAAGGGGVALVAAGAVIASANHLGGPRDVPALRVQAGQGACTAIGNLTSGPILVNGAPLGAPWAALNVVVP